MSKKIESAPYWSVDGLLLGAQTVLPALPGMLAFGVAVGAATATKGFTFLEAILMSGFVYAGMSQMVALEVWPAEITASALAGLALIAATVNARLLLLGASLRPWFGPLPAWQVYPLLHLLAEPNWLIAMRYRSEGGSDASIFLGSALVILVAWLGSTAAGHLLGALVTNPQAIGLDTVMPVFFVAMLVPLWRGATRAIPWIVAGAVALIVQYLAGGWWYIVAGSLAGSIAGGFIDDGE